MRSSQALRSFDPVVVDVRQVNQVEPRLVTDVPRETQGTVRDPVGDAAQVGREGVRRQLAVVQLALTIAVKFSAWKWPLRPPAANTCCSNGASG